MSEPQRSTLSSTDGLELAVFQWRPEGPVRGVVQLSHGMGEHLLRYAPLAEALVADGFVVVGQDHRGHGASMRGEPGAIGADGWRLLVDDVGLLVARNRAAHPGVPLVLLGHSMGSFAVQQWLVDHSREVDAAVLTGTAAIDPLGATMDFDAPLDLSAFNAPFEPARTEYDWLSRDEAQVDAYVADPLCGFGLDADASRAMFAGAAPLADPERLAGMRTDLPLYYAVGDADPVNGQLALLTLLLERYAAAGLTDVTGHVYPGARHEVFNETNRDEVVDDLRAWLDRVAPRA
ncbi:alpha/beta fold hydrolase [Rhodococcus aerolatus]